MLKTEVNIINSIIISLYMLFVFLSGMKALSGIEVFIQIAILGISFLPLVYKTPVSLLGIFLFVCVLLLGYVQGNPSIIFIFITAPLLALFSLTKNFNLKILYFTFGIICLVFLYQAQRDSLDDFKNTSRNYVSVIMLYNSILISLITYNQTKKIIIWPYLFCLIFSLLAIGRGGIICSFLCFIGILIYKIHKQLSKKIRFCVFSFLIIIIVISIPEILILFEQIEYFERLNEMGLEDDARSYVWDAYISSMNTERLLFGYDLESNKVIHSFGNNPHNSYILLHAHMGILVLVPVFLVLYSIIIHVRKNEYVYIIPLIAILLRGFTDIIFLSQYDFIVLIIVMHAFMDKNINKSLIDEEKSFINNS